MAKASTTIVKTDSSKVEFKTEGKLLVTQNGGLVVETPDYGLIDILNYVNELNLLNENVEVKVTLKEECKEEIDPTEIA